MTDEKTPRKLELSPAQVAGSALAAISGAFFASWAGTTGTIIGAALGSVIATVGAATYTWSLRRTSAVVKRTTAVVRENGMQHRRPAALRRAPRRPPDVRRGRGARESEAAEAESTSEGAPGWRRSLRGLPWGRVAVVAAAVLVAALAAITGFEAITGKPVSAYTGGSQKSGTSLGSLVGIGDPDHDPDAAAPPTPTPTAVARRRPDPDAHADPGTPTPP